MDEGYEMDLNKQFKEIITKSYDTQASFYAKNLSMQSGNLKKLLGYLFKSGVSFHNGDYLDLGCGTGILTREIQTRSKFKNLKINYCGIDRSYEMIKLGKSRNKNNFIRGDIECLPFRKKSFALAISNSVLHWLNIPEKNQTPREALIEVFRVLKINSPLAISVSGYGTAKRFQESYKKVMGYFKNDPDFNAELYREDPIGNMHLIDLVKILIDVGFKIERAQLDYEPIRYKHPSDYVNAVKAYGYEMYLAPVPKPKREMAWKKIKDDFIEKIGNREYEHDQYMIYVVAFKTANKHLHHQTPGITERQLGHFPSGVIQ